MLAISFGAIGWYILAVLLIAGSGWFFGEKAMSWLAKNKKG